MRLAVRGYIDGRQVFEDFIDGNDADIDRIATAQMERLVKSGKPHMVEIEFLDEPDPLTRFFRFGSDPRYMREPIVVRPGWHEKPGQN